MSFINLEQGINEWPAVARYEECDIFRTPGGQFVVRFAGNPAVQWEAATIPAAYNLCRTIMINGEKSRRRV